MSERIKSFLITFAVPLLMLAAALGAAELRIQAKEDQAKHDLDVAQLWAWDKATYELVLDMRCETKPTDRRCK